jgi:DNA helicase-2/ATP-dependent DNA helicase PcrA
VKALASINLLKNENKMEFIESALNDIQLQAATSPARALRLLAGAGSGKTRVLVYRMAWLFQEKQIPLNRILAVTFTNKAANEMKVRLQDLIGSTGHALWVGTFHGIANRILRLHANLVGLEESFQIIDSDDQLRLITRIVRDQSLDEELYEPKRIQIYINRQKDEGKRAQKVSMLSRDAEIFQSVYQRYENHCLQNGTVDFAELLLKVYELWRDNPDILAEYRFRFLHVLVDEFQDTNTIQYAWLKLLIGPENAITIVGDDDQSIYGWRGAKVENIQRFKQDFPDEITIRLEQNYRSSGVILEAANALIENNQSRLGKNLWTQGESGELITLYGAFNEVDEARFMVDRLQKWLVLHPESTYSDVAMLYRSNAQSRILEQALRQANIPYRIYGGLRFFDRAEIKDALAYLKLLIHPKDDLAFERAVNMPPRGIGERTLDNIRQLAILKNLSLWEASVEYVDTASGKIRNGLNRFFTTISSLQALLANAPLTELISQVINLSGLLEYLQQQPGERQQFRIENLKELVTASAQFNTTSEQETSILALPAFLAEIALNAGDESKKEADQPSSMVSLMTLHSAKGLEFNLIFLSGLEEGLFPHHRCANVSELLEEERRLCYVGLTRARQKIFITYAEKRAFAGMNGNKRPSRFIQEIPRHLVQTESMVSTVSFPRYADKSFRQPKGLFATAQGNSQYALGSRVVHPKFGEGVVIQVEGDGEMARIQVNFVEHGVKWLVAAYANLTLLDTRSTTL